MAISAIGVDLGADTFKAVRLGLRDGVVTLSRLGFVDLGELGQMPESEDRRLALQGKLQQMVQEGKLQHGLLQRTRVNLGLAGVKVSYRFLQTIPVPRVLLEKKVAFEVNENITAKSKVPLSYNYRILDTPQQDQTTALIGLALEPEVEAARRDCRRAGLGDATIDFSALGLYNAYLYGHGPCFRQVAAPAGAASPTDSTAGDDSLAPATPPAPAAPGASAAPRTGAGSEAAAAPGIGDLEPLPVSESAPAGPDSAAGPSLPGGNPPDGMPAPGGVPGGLVDSDDPETVAIIDIGAAEIKILICSGDDLYFVKSNGGGGHRFSQSLAKLLQVKLYEAEAVKCEDPAVTIDPQSGNTLRLRRTEMLGRRASGANSANGSTDDDTPATDGIGGPQDGSGTSSDAIGGGGAGGEADVSDTGSWLDDAAGDTPAVDGPGGAARRSHDTVVVEDLHPEPPGPTRPGQSLHRPGPVRGGGALNVGAVGGGRGAPGGSGARPAPIPAEAVPGPVSITTASGGTLIDPAALDSGESILNLEGGENGADGDSDTGGIGSAAGADGMVSNGADDLEAPGPLGGHGSTNATDAAAGASGGPGGLTGLAGLAGRRLTEAELAQLQRRLSNLLVREAAAICANIESAVQFCRQQHRVRALRLNRVLITGGGARLRGLTGYIQRRMRIPVEQLDPFRNIRIELPEDQFERLKQERDRLAVPIGLALAVLKPKAAHLPVITTQEAARRHRVNRTMYLWYSAALVAGIVGLGIIFANRHNESYGQYYRQVEDRYLDARRASDELHQKTRALELLRRETNAVELRVNSGSFLANLLNTLKSKDITQDNIWFTEITTVTPDFLSRQEMENTHLREDEVMAALQALHANAHLLRDKRLYLRGFAKSTVNRTDALRHISELITRLSKERATTPAERTRAPFDQAWLLYYNDANLKEMPKEGKGLFVLEFVLECRLYENNSDVIGGQSVLPPQAGQMPAGKVGPGGPSGPSGPGGAAGAANGVSTPPTAPPAAAHPTVTHVE
ncbi:MAG: pilus assembly protein PilM [Planctomycetota bacterium]